MTMNEILLKNITELIKMHGITDSECLGRCGVHSNFLSNLKTGKLKSPSFENIYAIAKFFKVSIDRLAYYVPESGKPEIVYDNKRSARIMYNAYTKLDAIGKQAVNETIIREQKRINNKKISHKL